MPRHREEDEHGLPPEESSVTQYDSPSDSTQGSEGGSSQSGHTTHSTSLHSGRSRRLAAPVPVHAQGLYRADGMVYHPLTGGRPAGPGDGGPLRRAPSVRSVRGMYDPDLHDDAPPPPPPRGKEAVSGDSLSYGSQPEYVHYVNPPPMSGLGPYSWADSTSGTSQELYFRGHRKYFRRSFCSVCLSVSIVTVIIAVIGIVAIAAYLGVMTTDDSEALKYEMQYSGKFRVARGDFFHPSLADKKSIDFQDKAERYQKMIETLYGYSYLSDAFRRASVESFGNDSLTVFFRVHLDRRKIPTSVLNTEEAVRDVVTQEVMSLEPRAFRAISVDIDSIEIKREQKDGASNAPFISRGDGGGVRRQETSPSRPRPGPAAGDQSGPDKTDSSRPAAAPTPAPRQPHVTPAVKDSERADSASEASVELAGAEPTTERAASLRPSTAAEQNEDKESRVPVPAEVEKDEKDQTDDHEESLEPAGEEREKGQETGQETEGGAESQEDPQSGSTADVMGPNRVPQTKNGVTEPDGDTTELGSQPSGEPAAGTSQTVELDLTEAVTEATESNTPPAVGNNTQTEPEAASQPSFQNSPEHPMMNHGPVNHLESDSVTGNHSPVERDSVESSPGGATTEDPLMTSPAPIDIRQQDTYLPNSGGDTKESVVYDDTTENSYYDDYYDIKTEEAVLTDLNDRPISYEVADQPDSFESIPEEVATELAPFLAASVPQEVNRIGYVDLSAPTNSQTDSKPTEPPRYDDFTNIQVGTAYFGGLAPVPAQAPAPAPNPAPAWAQLGPSGAASTPSSASAAVAAPAEQTDDRPQPQRPAPAAENRDESPLYDYSPWNPIIPAFAQSIGQVGRPGSLFPDGGGVRRGGEYPPAVTVRPRPSPTLDTQEYAPVGVTVRPQSTPTPEVTTTRGSFIQVVQQQQQQRQETSVGPVPTRPSYTSIPIPESVSIQQTLRFLPTEADDTDSQEDFDPAESFQPGFQASSRLGAVSRPRPESVIPNRPRPRPHPRPSTRPSPRPTASSTEYHTEVSTSEVREESQVRPEQDDHVRPHSGQIDLLEPASGVDRLGIAFVTRSPTRRPVPAPTATTTQRVVVVNAAPAEGDVRPAGDNVDLTQPDLRPVTSYVGEYRPIRPPLLAVTGPNRPPPTFQQPQPGNTGKQGSDGDDADNPEPVVVSPQPETGPSFQSDQPPLPTGVSSVLAGALGGALSGAPDTPSASGDTSAPSREQLLNMFRLIALRYPALVANMDQQQLQLLLNNEVARRKLLAPFLVSDKSRTPGEPQRTNTKLLELANISINSTQVDRRGNGRALRREVAGGASSNRPPPPRRPSNSRLSSSMLKALANFTRVKVAGGPPKSSRPWPGLTTSSGSPTHRPQSGLTGSLSDRLHQLVAFPTRAPPRGANRTITSSSRGKLSHKLMRFHGERTNPDGGEYDRAPLFAALRGATTAPSVGHPRNLLRHTTQLPNSSPVHVIHYYEGESVQDILDKIFARFHQKTTQNKVKTTAQKPWAVRPTGAAGHSGLPAGRPSSAAAQPSFSASQTITTTMLPSQPTVSSTSIDSYEPTESSPKTPQVTSRPPGGSSWPTEVAKEADNEVGTTQLQAGAVSGPQPPIRPAPASPLRNQTVDSCIEPTDFACRTLGGCVPASSRCDRRLDCADGSDERDCTCADRLRAQSLHRKLCDGVVDCHDSTDEQFCEWCRPDQFICPEAKHCVDRSALCDGKFDCDDGADERHCVTLDSSASEAETGGERYSRSGLLLVRKRGVWGRLCVDRLDGVVRQTRGSWGTDDLGTAVCKALTYQDAKEVKMIGPNVAASKTETTDEPFFKLLFSSNTVLPEAEKASLVFAEDMCPRQTALHVTCDRLRCGLRPRVKQRQARIVGGGNSSPGAWPWQAAMYRDGEYQCGATLISDRWLLSAGHCYLRSTTRYWLARLGAYRRDSSLLSPYERLHEVSHVIMHPEYQDAGYVHDIALLRLAQPVPMSDFVRPACLPPPKSEIQNGAMCTVVGWGQLYESSKIFPDTLQEVQVPLISTQECKKRTVFLPLYKITENMFCAGYERGGRDACLGDSGGPLMCQESTGEWTLTGITSNGYGCARADRPGVYTKVANYSRWIDDVMSGALAPTSSRSCLGHRCRLGRCLSSAEVCDGKVHCSDGSDEEHCGAKTGRPATDGGRHPPS